MAIKIFGNKPKPDLAKISDSKSQSVFRRLGQRNAVTGLLRPDGKCFVFHGFAFLVVGLAAPVTPE
jgi:hypothetical protein